ncbi:MAG: hypothetical protein M5U13_17045 [Thermoanaerobaculia bacterium]|nr:hypothetical protein [Thermoanaerobaculia bacterium]
MRDRVLAQVRCVLDSPVGLAVGFSLGEIESALGKLEEWLPAEDHGLVVVEFEAGRLSGFRYRMQDVVIACANVGAGIVSQNLLLGVLTALAGFATLSGVKNVVTEKNCLLVAAASSSDELLTRARLLDSASDLSITLCGQHIPAADLESSLDDLISLGVLRDDETCISISEVCFVNVGAAFSGQGRY